MNLNLKLYYKRIKDMLFAGGFGITLHSIANEMYYKGGYKEILSFQGEYIGLTIMLISFLLISFAGEKDE